MGRRSLVPRGMLDSTPASTVTTVVEQCRATRFHSHVATTGWEAVPVIRWHYRTRYRRCPQGMECTVGHHHRHTAQQDTARPPRSSLSWGSTIQALQCMDLQNHSQQQHSQHHRPPHDKHTQNLNETEKCSLPEHVALPSPAVAP